MRSFELDGWQVRPDRNLLTRGEERVRLEPRVMDLLVHFAEHPDQVLARDDLVREVWPETFVGDAALHTAISSLRRAFGDDARSPRVIETIPRRGYRLIAEVSRPRSIAVLPLRDPTDDPGEEFFVDGMTDGVIDALGRLGDLHVISRSSVMAWRRLDSDLGPTEIAARLGAELLLEGSALREGGRVRLSMRLLDGPGDRELWSGSDERPLRAVPALLRDLVSDIAEALDLPARAEPPTRGRRAVDPRAWVEFLRGRFHWYKLSPTSFPVALQHFQRAVEIDPGFGDAHAGIADVWGAHAYWGLSPPAEMRDRVRDAITTALEADPSSADAWAIQGSYLLYFGGDREGAERSVDRALALNPSAAHAHLVRALLLLIGRRDVEALEAAAQAVRLDPLNPAVCAVRAICLAIANRRSESIATLHEALELDPDHRLTNQLLADRHWGEGRDELALAHERLWWRSDREVVGLLERAERSHLRTALIDAADRLAERSRNRWVQPTEVARLYVHGGMPERAFDWLDAALRSRDPRLIDGYRADLWDPLREDPRFEQIVRALRLS